MLLPSSPDSPQASAAAPRHGARLPRRASLTVIMPCYNEEKTLAVGLERVMAIAGDDLDLEILIVDDCSRDRSREIAEDYAARHPQIKLLKHAKNQGKGAALHTGFRAATSEFVAIQDADLEYDPMDLRKLLVPLAEGHADVVIGSRFAGDGAHRVLYFWHSLGNRFLTLLSNMLTDLNLTDMETCYKVFRREVIQGLDLKEKRFGFEPEVVAKIAQQRLRIYELGVGYRGRTYAEGKKINWKDGVRALYCILKYNLPKVPAPVQFLFYLGIGGSCALLNLLAFLCLLHSGLPPFASALTAFAAAAVANYLLSTALLFRSQARWRRRTEIAIYAVMVSLIGLADSAATRGMILAGLAPVAAKLIATAVGLVLNFIGRRNLVFYEKPNADWKPQTNIPAPAESSASGANPIKIGILVSAAIITALSFRLVQSSTYTPFDFDECDYARSLRAGFVPAYLGTREMGGIRFAQDTWKEYKTTGSAHPWRKGYLAGDLAALRHYHAPLALYPAAILMSAGVTQEWALRMVPIAFSLGTVFLAGMLAFILLPGLAPGQRWGAGGLAALIAGASGYLAGLSANLSFHSAFTCFALAELCALARACRTGQRLWWRIACVAMAFCILTLEYWVLLVPGMLFTLALLAKREERPIRWAAKEALMGALLLAATAGILWPPFLFSLSYLNTVAIYLKFMVSPLPTEEFSRHWLRSLLAAHPFLLSAFAASGAGLFALPALRSAGKKSPLAEYAPWVPLILFALGFIVLNMRVAHMKPLYAAHLVPSLAVLAALLFGLAWGRLGAWRWGALAVLAIGFSIQARDHFTRFQLKPWEGQVASIREETRGKQVLAVFNYPFFEYYLDGARVTAGWTTEEELAAAKADLAQGRYDVVCGLTDATRSSWPGFPSEAELKAWGYAPGASQVGALTAHVWTKSDAAKGVGSAAN